jgi:hypothetical protein
METYMLLDDRKLGLYVAYCTMAACLRGDPGSSSDEHPNKTTPRT